MLQVWRPAASAAGAITDDTYMLVGQTFMRLTELRFHEISLYRYQYGQFENHFPFRNAQTGWRTRPRRCIIEFLDSIQASVLERYWAEASLRAKRRMRNCSAMKTNHEISLPPALRLSVRRGDVLGLYYPDSNPTMKNRSAHALEPSRSTSSRG